MASGCDRAGQEKHTALTVGFPVAFGRDKERLFFPLDNGCANQRAKAQQEAWGCVLQGTVRALSLEVQFGFWGRL